MGRYLMPHRVTLWKKGNIDYSHVLSDGYGIPAIVIGCPQEKKFEKFSGRNEDGDRVKGISFDDCIDCKFFRGFGLGQEIFCNYKKQR